MGVDVFQWELYLQSADLQILVCQLLDNRVREAQSWEKTYLGTNHMADVKKMNWKQGVMNLRR